MHCCTASVLWRLSPYTEIMQAGAWGGCLWTAEYMYGLVLYVWISSIYSGNKRELEPVKERERGRERRSLLMISRC